jgi:hypothetical protein
MAVRAGNDAVLHHRLPGGRHSGDRRDAGRQIPAKRPVRIAVSVRSLGGCLAWWRRPRSACNRTLYPRFPIFLHFTDTFACHRVSGPAEDRAVRAHGGFRGVRLRGAKAHGGIAAARARRSAGKRSRAANRERRTDPGGTSCAASGARASVDDRHDPGNRGALSSRRLARFCQPDLADLYRSFTGQFVGTPLGSCYSSR